MLTVFLIITFLPFAVTSPSRSKFLTMNCHERALGMTNCLLSSSERTISQCSKYKCCMIPQPYWTCVYMFIITHKCTITIVLHAQAHNYRHPKYTWYYSDCYSLCLVSCNHIQKERLLTWVVIMRSSSERHTPIASPYAQMTLDHPWSDQATAMKDWSEKDLVATFTHFLDCMYTL